MSGKHRAVRGAQDRISVVGGWNPVHPTRDAARQRQQVVPWLVAALHDVTLPVPVIRRPT